MSDPRTDVELNYRADPCRALRLLRLLFDPAPVEAEVIAFPSPRDGDAEEVAA